MIAVVGRPLLTIDMDRFPLVIHIVFSPVFFHSYQSVKVSRGGQVPVSFMALHQKHQPPRRHIEGKEILERRM
jgi:hypothetical protein